MTEPEDKLFFFFFLSRGQHDTSISVPYSRDPRHHKHVSQYQHSLCPGQLPNRTRPFGGWVFLFFVGWLAAFFPHLGFGFLVVFFSLTVLAFLVKCTHVNISNTIVSNCPVLISHKTHNLLFFSLRFPLYIILFSTIKYSFHD